MFEILYYAFMVLTLLGVPAATTTCVALWKLTLYREANVMLLEKGRLSNLTELNLALTEYQEKLKTNPKIAYTILAVVIFFVGLSVLVAWPFSFKHHKDMILNPETTTDW
ncbi:TMhelix containing protein [Vibrio phage 1.121.O._10N.286.46.C4]|nr:TMhelix containing protein [Vibrio phage 1.121.O._10N.286.46.C4]